MFTTVFPPVLTVIPLRQADIIYIFTYITYCIYHIIYINIFIYISGGGEDSAALGGRRRPRQDRGDAGGGKSGPLCARSGECLERDEAGC
jgi:hypothetical protein